MATLTHQELGAILVTAGIVDAAAFSTFEKESNRTHKSIEELLIERGVIHDHELGQLIADAKGWEFVNLRSVTVDPDTVGLLPEAVARAQHAVIFEKKPDGAISAALSDPDNTEFIHLLEKRFGPHTTIYYATSRDIDEAMSKYRKGLESDFAALLRNNAEGAKNARPDDAPVVSLVDLLFSYAYENRASDIHIEPLDEEVAVRFRIDGMLHEVGRFPKNIHEVLVARIKILAKLRIDEHRSAQDGKIVFTPPAPIVSEKAPEDIEIRVSIVPITAGEKVVMRLLSARGQEFVLKDLGIPEKDLVKIEHAMKRSHGMILSTGPTGSGKTTTLYAALKELNTEEVNIATIEDPVEYEIEGINQIQVNAKTNLTFVAGLRAILRQDPDIIMVGEIRDNETADIAVNSAMTGHLVLSTLHTNDAATTIPRLLDMGIEPFLIASTVNVVIAQRLVRTICLQCRETVEIGEKEEETLKEERVLFDLFKSIAKKPLSEVRLYRGAGCPICNHTGYAGRVGIFEVLEITEKLRAMIMERATADTIKQQGVAEGMTTMIEDGIRKILEGVTTVEEVLRIIRE